MREMRRWRRGNETEDGAYHSFMISLHGKNYRRSSFSVRQHDTFPLDGFSMKIRASCALVSGHELS